jgi:WXG100 family type VII secretion target
MALQNQVDDAAVRQMVAALQRTDADCDAAMRAVNSSTSYLDSVWKGDAANRYRSALQDWTEGLNRVQRGVRELNDAMTQYYHSSAQVEDDNSAAASWT